MRVTQQDIARIAAVSQATVSRVLAGDTRVEPETRSRVLGVMEESNYRPDVRAQSLRKKRTELIGIVLKRERNDAADDPFVSSLITAITQALSKTPYHLCFDIAHSPDHQSKVYDEMLRTRRVDGLLLVEPESDDARLQRLDRDNFPFVVIGNPKIAAWHSVDNDNVLASRMATLHLIEQGNKDIVFLSGPRGLTVCEDRITGYEMAMREHSLVPRVVPSDFGHEAAYSRTVALTDRMTMPEALLAMDDFMATGVLRAAIQAGLTIPQDLAMASFNDSTICQLIPSGLTSVNMNLPILIQEAVKKLILLVESKDAVPPSRYVAPAELIVRGSSRRRAHLS
ncbi:MAG: LacI family DNA-binding transcriptional regulator [Fimbriimonadaceae bacterium]